MHYCFCFAVLPVDHAALQTALRLPGNDFEDNLQIACAYAAGLDAIITRDKVGFKGVAMRVLTPGEALQQLGLATS